MGEGTLAWERRHAAVPGVAAGHPADPDPAHAGARTCPYCGGVVRRDRAAGAPLPVLALPPSIATAIRLARTLSPRERAVFLLLGLGYDNRSLARELAVSERTVKRHVTAILSKLRLESRLQAGLAALVTVADQGQLRGGC